MDTTTVPKSTTRLQRGIALHRERGHEIERIAAHTYSVPSCTGEGTYTAYTDLRCCTCPDHRRAKEAGERCKHIQENPKEVIGSGTYEDPYRLPETSP